MKSNLGCIHNKFRGNFKLLDDLIPVLIPLTNYNMKKHPLRANNHPNIEIYLFMTSKSIRILAEAINQKRTGISKSFEKYWWKMFMERNRALFKIEYITCLEESRASVKNPL